VADCMNMFEIRFPLSTESAAKNQILVNEKPVNATYYTYQDKYTFWYKFIVNEPTTIDFSITPTNKLDRYRTMVYAYAQADFCDKLVNSDLEPIPVVRAPIFLPDNTIAYRNRIVAKRGEVYQVVVLSLNDEDCGHHLKVEASGKELSIHAIHRPCYNFEQLHIPDFSLARKPMPNVKLYLEQFQEKEAVPEEALAPEPEPQRGYGNIETIEKNNNDEAFVTAGDRLVLNNVFFYNNTYAFKPGSNEELNQLVLFLKGNPEVNVEIQGHTNSSTDDIKPDPQFKNQSPEWNFRGSAFKLSEKRAEAVRDYLIKYGIDKRRLSAIGYGDTQKRVYSTTFEESEKNMRVEILVVE
jgi:outer membrane protein OmpA-like peptidoglycan-associated protein